MKTFTLLLLVGCLAPSLLPCHADDPTAVLSGRGGGTILSLHDNLRAPLQWSHPKPSGGGMSPMQSQQMQPSPQQQLMMLQQEMNRVQGLINGYARSAQVASQNMQAAAAAGDGNAYQWYQNAGAFASSQVQQGRAYLARLQQQARMIIGR